MVVEHIQYTALLHPDNSVSVYYYLVTRDGSSGDGALIYEPDDPNYDAFLLFIGGLKEGEVKAVPEGFPKPILDN